MGNLGWKSAEPAKSAGPWLPTVALLASRPQRPQDAHAPGAALQAGNARPWPMAGYIHPRRLATMYEACRMTQVFNPNFAKQHGISQNACPGRAGWGKPGQSAVLWASFLL